MKNKFRFIVFLFCVTSLGVNAQQDEQSSMYMFNPLHYNPAYAGSRGDMSLVGIFRSQWLGINGAPVSQFLSFHSPLSYKNMAAGLNISNDKIGARNRTAFFGNYAYTLRFENGGKLNLGLSAGGDIMSVDFNKLKAYDPTEVDYLTSFSSTTFNIGTGAYYYTDNFYVGISTPRVLNTVLKNNGITLSDSYTKKHFFLASGYVYPINSIVDLKSSFLLKMTPNAPITLDLNSNVFLYKKYWAGIMYRFNESIGVNLAYQHKESLMIGYAYDFPINGLSSVKNGGSHEIMLTYDFNRNKAFGSPRYF
jgi:type IX secretion system PorP/SprF family membrane protein